MKMVSGEVGSIMLKRAWMTVGSPKIICHRNQAKKGVKAKRSGNMPHQAARSGFKDRVGLPFFSRRRSAALAAAAAHKPCASISIALDSIAVPARIHNFFDPRGRA